MKILMIHPHDIFSLLEPWTIRAVRLACQLGMKGHQVVLAHFPYSKTDVKKVEGVRIVALEREMSLGAFMRNSRSLRLLAKEVDIVHFQKSQFYAALPALWAAYMAGKPLHYDWDDWEERIFYRSIERQSLSTCLTGVSFFLMERSLPFLVDSISVASEALKTLAVKRGANKSKIIFVPVGADMRQFNPARDGNGVRKKYNLTSEILVLYHGQLHSCQYVKLFLEAIRLICKKTLDYKLRFMVIGGGSEFSRLQNFAKKLGIIDQVIFTDFVSHTEVPLYLVAADICVAPFEDNDVTRCKSPLKIVEYLASGKPVVASHVGEVGHMLNGVGILVKPGSAEELARGVMELVQDPVRRRSLGLEARKRAEAFSWHISVEKLERVYLDHLRLN